MPKAERLLCCRGHQRCIGLVDEDLGARGVLDRLVRAHVVEVAVGVHDVLDLEALVLDQLQDVLRHRRRDR